MKSQQTIPEGLRRAIDQHHAAINRFVNGDCRLWKELCSQRLLPIHVHSHPIRQGSYVLTYKSRVGVCSNGTKNSAQNVMCSLSKSIAGGGRYIAQRAIGGGELQAPRCPSPSLRLRDLSRASVRRAAQRCLMVRNTDSLPTCRRTPSGCLVIRSYRVSGFSASCATCRRVRATTATGTSGEALC